MSDAGEKETRVSDDLSALVVSTEQHESFRSSWILFFFLPCFFLSLVSVSADKSEFNCSGRRTSVSSESSSRQMTGISLFTLLMIICSGVESRRNAVAVFERDGQGKKGAGQGHPE